jgi:hypothetical protein
MFVSHEAVTTDPEEALRALGALLDAQRARGVLVMQTQGGLLVRARVPQTDGAPRGDSLTVPLERQFDDAAIQSAAIDAFRRRGSGRVSGPIERDLRLIGSRIRDDAWRDYVVIQVDRGWVVRHRREDAEGVTITMFDEARLLVLEASAIAQRRAVVAA